MPFIVPACPERLIPEVCSSENPEAGLLIFELMAPDERKPGAMISGNPNAMDFPVTLARMVGEICLSSQIIITSAANTVCCLDWWMGIYIADTDDQLSPVTMVPGPNMVTVNENAYDNLTSGDWLWRNHWAHVFGATSGAAISVESNQYSPSAHIDVRVKRKVKGSEGIYLAVQGTFQTKGGGVVAYEGDLMGQVRGLVLLP